MRTRTALLLLLAAAPFSCTSQTDGQDAAVVDDALPPQKDGAQPDGASLSCNDISQRVQQILAEHLSCASDKDCTIVVTACGLPGDCDTDGVYANQEWRTAEMDRLIGDWTLRLCGPKACVCPRGPVREPACNRGVCGPKAVAGNQPIGAACAADADCQSGQCLTEAEDKRFSGGYCTLKNCDKLGAACPTGSACKPIGPSSYICLQTCDAMRTCRAGYGCCGPGPAIAGWCSPKDSPVCMLR